MSELATAKEDLVKPRVKRANLHMAVSDSVLEIRQDSAEFVSALQSVVQSSSRSSKNVSEKVEILTSHS